MQIGVIGLGRMGGNIARRLMRHGHEAIIHDRDSRVVAALVRDGAIGVAGIDQLAHKLSRPRAVWMMLPAGEITEAEIARLAALHAPKCARCRLSHRRFEPRGPLPSPRARTLPQRAAMGSGALVHGRRPFRAGG